MEGIFITVEGNEGSGKTTAVALLKEKLVELRDENKIEYNVCLTREPGGIKISEEIRKIILDTENTNMDLECEALLYAAARAQNVHEVLIPKLKEKNIVLCDRYLDSSLVYQGYARGIGIDEVYELNKFAIKGYLPNLTFLLKIPHEKGIERIRKRKEINRLDKESLDFHKKVEEGYDIIAKKYSDRIIIIDAEQTTNEIVEEMLGYILKYIENNRK
ncbi:MAG: dTMP kinase [Clostridium sp.]